MERGARGPEKFAVGGFAFALKHLAAAAGGIAPSRDGRQAELQPGVVRGERRTEFQAGHRDHAEAAPLRVARLHDRVHQLQRGGRAFAPHHARIAVAEERFAGGGQLDDDRERGEDLVGGEPRDDAGNAEFHEVFADGGPRDGVHMAGVQERVRAAFQRLVRVRHGLVRAEDREVREPFGGGFLHRQACRRDRRLESDRQEHDLLVRVFPCEVDRVQRRIDGLHRRALGTRPREAHFRAGHADQVAERADDRAVFEREHHGLVNVPGGRHADRASGAGDELDLRRQDAADAETEDLVGVGAADLHDAEFAPVVGLDDLFSRFHQATP